MELDVKDRRILYELDTDSKQSSNAIAKKVGLSKDAVNYRINKMLDSGVIKNFYLMVNTVSLGYMHFNTMIRFRHIDEKIKQEFIEFCKNNTKVLWFVSCYGNWDFSVSFLAKDLSEYTEFMKIMLQRFGEDIFEKTMSLLIECPTYPKNYLSEKPMMKEFGYNLEQKNKIDRIEHRILSRLSTEANINYNYLAERLNLTPDVVRYRVKQLLKKGVIQGFRANVNVEKIGYSYYKLLFALKDMTLERETAFKEYCKLNTNILQLVKYLGNWEIHLEIEVKSESDLYKIIEEIRNKFGDIVKNYEILKMKEEKVNYYPFG